MADLHVCRYQNKQYHLHAYNMHVYTCTEMQIIVQYMQYDMLHVIIILNPLP